MFGLGITCGETQYQDNCDHGSEERALLGAWTMDEDRKDVENGYVIFYMFELWEYELAKYENRGLLT